jgi:hypothetical protein
MKTAFASTSLLFVSVLLVAASASATPFAPFDGQYKVVSQSCAMNMTEVPCDTVIEIVDLQDNETGTESVLTLSPGLTYTMSTYSEAGRFHESTWAGFAGGVSDPLWTREFIIGDVGNQIIRQGVRIQMSPVPSAFVLNVTAYGYGPGRVTTYEQKLVLELR